jgi:hypothetical protein
MGRGARPALCGSDRISTPPLYREARADLGAEQESRFRACTLLPRPDDVIEIPASPSSTPLSHRASCLPCFRRVARHLHRSPIDGRSGSNAKVKAATAELAPTFFDLAFDGNETTLTRWNATWQPTLVLPPDVAPPPVPIPRSRSTVQDRRSALLPRGDAEGGAMRKRAFIHKPLFCTTRKPNADVAQIEVTFGRVSTIDLYVPIYVRASTSFGAVVRTRLAIDVTDAGSAR